jgi:hypothetical protein
VEEVKVGQDKIRKSRSVAFDLTNPDDVIKRAFTYVNTEKNKSIDNLITSETKEKDADFVI